MAGRMAFAAAATVLQKVQYSTVSEGLVPGVPKPFRKPIFMSITAQTAMTCVGLLGAAAQALLRHRRGSPTPADSNASAEAAAQSGADLESGATATPPDVTASHSYWQKVGLAFIPAVFDLIAALFTNVALLYLPASVLQMLRASGIVFTALLSVSFLGKRMIAIQWCGIAVCCLGVMLAGTSDLTALSTDGLEWMLLAIAFALMSQFIGALQAIGEEALIKKLDLPPLETLGWEGLWGLVLVLGIVQPVASTLPGPDNGHLEDFADTLAMLANNPELLAVQSALFIAMGSSTCMAILVTALLNSVHRKILNCCGSIPVWGFALTAWYLFGDRSGFGEAWNSLSFLELAGFGFIVVGQAAYGGLVHPPRWLGGGSSDGGSGSGTGQGSKCDTEESVDKTPSSPEGVDAEVSTDVSDTASESSCSVSWDLSDQEPNDTCKKAEL